MVLGPCCTPRVYARKVRTSQVRDRDGRADYSRAQGGPGPVGVRGRARRESREL